MTTILKGLKLLDNVHYTHGNNHLKLCTTIRQVTYKMDNLPHLLKYEKNTTKYHPHTKYIG